MSDFELPEDLIQIQRDIDAARRAADDYVAAVEAELAALPVVVSDDGEAPPSPTWTAEQKAELKRLRDAYMAAAKRKWAHPARKTGLAFEEALWAAARSGEPAAS